jgi:hypothetical protein
MVPVAWQVLKRRGAKDRTEDLENVTFRTRGAGVSPKEEGGKKRALGAWADVEGGWSLVADDRRCCVVWPSAVALQAQYSAPESCHQLDPCHVGVLHRAQGLGQVGAADPVTAAQFPPQQACKDWGGPDAQQQTQQTY